MKKQQGMSLIGILLLVSAGCFLALTAMRATPIYIEHYSVLSAMSGIPNGTKPMEIRNRLERTFSVNDIDRVVVNDVKISPVKNGYELSLKYDVPIPLVANIDLVIRFNDKVVVPFSGS